MFQTKIVKLIKTQCIFRNFFRMSCLLRDNVEKYGAEREATDNVIERMRFGCRISKATGTHS